MQYNGVGKIQWKPNALPVFGGILQWGIITIRHAIGSTCCYSAKIAPSQKDVRSF